MHRLVDKIKLFAQDKHLLDSEPEQVLHNSLHSENMQNLFEESTLYLSGHS